MKEHRLFGVRIHDLSSGELDHLILGWLQGDRVRTIVTPNPEFLLAARANESFRNLLNRADLAIPDGVGIRFAIPALTGGRLSYRHTGVDTLLMIARACASSKKRLALLGGNPGVAKRAAERLRGAVSGLSVEGIDPGFVDPNHLEDSFFFPLDGFSVIAVGLGQGKQETIMEILGSSRQPVFHACRILIGVGGAFDMISGTKRRAPNWMRASGLEWLWRAWIEPGRIGRILSAFPVFPAIIIRDTLKHRRFKKACLAVIPEIFRQLRGL